VPPPPPPPPPPQVAQVVCVKNSTRRTTAIERKVCVFIARDYRNESLGIASKTSLRLTNIQAGLRSRELKTLPLCRDFNEFIEPLETRFFLLGADNPPIDHFAIRGRLGLKEFPRCF